MRQLVYAMRFSGQATLASPDGAVLKTAATAPNSTVGLAGTLEPAVGGKARFASEVTVTGATSFQEVGRIAFDAGSGLRFAAIGSGYLGASPDPARRHGAVIWRVVGSEGQLAGASGLITSNFLVDEDLGIVGHHLGILFVP